jgi:hypothetical protein
MHSLVTMAEKHGVHAIKERLQVDEQYALQLSALVSRFSHSTYEYF